MLLPPPKMKDTFNTIRPLSRKQIDDFWKALPPIRRQEPDSIHNNLWHCSIEEIRPPDEHLKVVHPKEKGETKKVKREKILLDFGL